MEKPHEVCPYSNATRGNIDVTLSASEFLGESRMGVQLNHTIVWCRDQQRSATFLTEVLGLPAATRFGPFLVVAVDNDISLDFHEIDGEIASQHYAFVIAAPD